jgi:pimeloyl-ACP methyl ester carboxylesterase
VFEPEDPVAGFIFYPGGLVQTEAYAPLMEQLAEQGIFGVLVEMPYYLAMFDANGARGIQDEYPQIKDWYIGGHSLGGAMACLYADRHQSEYEGLILLAAYSTKDLTDDPAMNVLSIRGSEDKVINMENYEKNLSNLPEDFEEVIIDGCCHGYFGDYGMQSGDGTPTITVEEQTKLTVDEIAAFIGGK